MNPLHMVVRVPFAWKSFAWEGAFTIGEFASDLLVVVHSMGLSLVSQQTGRGRKGILGTSRLLAPVRLQVGVQVFATFAR